MRDIDSKVFNYTMDFSRQVAADVDTAALQDSIERHMESARKVVTNSTLERIGHVHLAVMINTAARYNLSLGEVMMQAVREGSQPIAPLCVAVEANKSSTRRTSGRPALRIVK